MKEAVAIIFLRSHPVAGLAVNWRVIDKDTGEIIRNDAFSRYQFEIVETVNGVMQDVIGVCNEFDRRLTGIQLKRG
ncbi:hypothetical protein QUF99_11145 [Bacillus sp. DX4.1]|uniref:hypothetical protein n=1 Tax=Bacillus sp. DX4.1 TaxID=3055867 RepID=UPI0025A15A4D|nr:hypothetical protein [Bacillus sp. DX4.1]MDM5187865.1 hypothetical protein [Bacillus sp. DX4.1]